MKPETIADAVCNLTDNPFTDEQLMTIALAVVDMKGYIRGRSSYGPEQDKRCIRAMRYRMCETIELAVDVDLRWIMGKDLD